MPAQTEQINVGNPNQGDKAVSRIINPETGKYENPPVAPTAAPPPSAAGLPTIQKDPFENVDHRAFHQADQLNRDQLLRMGTIAEQRGDAHASTFWKGKAMDRARDEQHTAEVEKMLDSWRPKPKPQHGSQVIAVPGTTPWEQDSEYQKLQGEVAAAAEIAKSAQHAGQQLEANQKLAGAQAALKDRENAIREEVIGSGQWTAQDERVLDAQRSLAEKAAALNPQSRSETQ